MIVKVAPMGERVSEVNVEDGAKVSAILSIAGVAVGGRTIRVDNEEATGDTTVHTDGAIITLAQKMKGGR